MLMIWNIYHQPKLLDTLTVLWMACWRRDCAKAFFTLLTELKQTGRSTFPGGYFWSRAIQLWLLLLLFRNARSLPDATARTLPVLFLSSCEIFDCCFMIPVRSWESRNRLIILFMGVSRAKKELSARLVLLVLSCFFENVSYSFEKPAFYSGLLLACW